MSEPLVKRTRTNRAKSGDFVRVPINEECWSCGRVVDDGTVAIYDIITMQERMVSEIVSSPILFRVPMMRFAFNGKEWLVVEHLPLEEELQAPAEFLAMRTWQNNKGKFYAVTMLSSKYMISYEQTKKLELLAIYEPVHVQQRLQLYIEGKPDPETELTRVK
ncbi:MAG: hypothetical protein EOP09_13435 [Proteobacteria bacterium]|nr:MAG: hypothetical protein EOP09_13435 [Pseudomonadota bacterium]